MTKEIWDAYYADGTLADAQLVRDEAIPQGLYHLACEVLVRHADGDYLLMQRDMSKPMYPGYYEATAGGSALRGEDAITCIRRELAEETGVLSGKLELVARRVYDDENTIFCSYLCVTDWDKAKITLQPGETISFKWVSEAEFIRFVNSDEMIDRQKARFLEYFTKKGYVR